MFYLFATILLNVFIFLIFKIFPKYKVTSLYAIVFNYWTCVVTGSLFYGSFPVSEHSPDYSWFWWALFNGGYFISLFNLMSYCTRRYGVTAATVPNKLSLVIPVLFSIALYNEEVSVLKIGGVLLAIPAIYLASRSKEDDGKKSGLFFPLLLFVSSGLLDTMLKYIEQRHLPNADSQAVFTIHVFLFAALFGTIVMITTAVRSNNMFKMRDVLAGVILGVPNYFSVYYFIRFLNSNVLESSAAIPVNNIGIVVVSSLAAILFLKEKPTIHRIAGLGLAVVAILMIAFS